MNRFGGIKNLNKPGGLDGLCGVWLALLILRMVITPQLTTKQSKIRTLDHALATITHTIDPQKSKIRTHGHALHHH
jgi:hypothetical protein